jgi:hypothetical protein
MTDRTGLSETSNQEKTMSERRANYWEARAADLGQHLANAHDLLRRVHWAMNEGYDEIPDVAHAICAEIEGLLPVEKQPGENDE